LLALTTAIAGCSSAKPGGYYKDDGPGGRPPVDLDRVADARPKAEPLHRGANNPYAALGKKYTPYRSLKPHRERGLASWYGRRFHGKPTASGERYDMYAMTAAHTILPIPSYARVTHLGTGRSVIVRINDRGPFRTDRIIDLSYAAAHRLGYVQAGSARVEVEAILPGKTSAAGEPESPRKPPRLRPV
jgi:rare lipoprotein A